MIKLLIVDDEPLVVVGLKSMLNWADYGIEVCATAVNGEAALKMIGEYSPQLVITDIRMPIMNGLELARLSREAHGKIPLFIFLTSYEEFQLIKEAMSYEAVDYLIKLELDEASLGEAVKKALGRLKELEATEAYRREGRPFLQNYYDKFLMRLLNNLFESPEQFELQAKDLHLDFSDRCYTVALCGITRENSSMDHGQLDNLYHSSFSLCQDILNKYLPCHMISLDMKHFCAIFHQPSTEERGQAAILTALENAGTMLYNYFSVRLLSGVGGPVDAPFRICDSYQEARQAFSSASEELPVSTFTQSPPDSIKNAFNLSLFKNDITRALEEFDPDVLFDTLTEIIGLFSHNTPPRVLRLVDGACSILYLAISLLPEGEETLWDIFSGYPDGYRSIYRLKTTEAIVEWMTTLRDGLCEVLKTRRKTYKAHVITNVQKYIKSHIAEHLSLNQVAGVFGLSPNYLSILFKKTCGMGFSEYITLEKVSLAKSMLLGQDMKIYEIAEQLGFESAFYFSKVFKKVEGVSPREYIQNNTEKPDEL